MAQINFGGVKENVVTREEFPLAKALEVLKNENHCCYRIRCTRSRSGPEPERQRFQRNRRSAPGK